MSARIDAATALAAIDRFAASFPNDPAEYARRVLRVRLTPDMRQACRELVTHRRLLVKAGHEVGKTFLGGVLVNWFYDSFRPGICLTTAPTDLQVRDLLWKEVRLLRGVRGGFRGPKMPRLEDAPNHWAHGFTARDADSFQGRHCENMMILFDEGTGCSPVFWEAAKTMFGNSPNSYWIVFFNPTSIASEPYRQERKLAAGWRTLAIPSTAHPNIALQLKGLPPAVPGAIQLAKLQGLLDEWCEPVVGEPDVGDFEWPPGSGKYLRPGPVAEGRLLARFPRSAVDTVWSDALVEKVEGTRHEVKDSWPIQIGCDVAHFGDDLTAIHVRQGLCSLHHEAHNGWPTTRTAARLKELCVQFGRRGHKRNDPKRIPVQIDVTGGWGAGVCDLAGDFNFVPVNSSAVASLPERYKSTRTELWFAAAELAAAGLVDVSRLPRDTWETIRQQLLTPKYKIDLAGRKVVEEKAETKKRCERSPDDADAFNLAYLVQRPGSETVIGTI